MANYILIAVNELKTARDMACLEGWLDDPQKRVFLDSGIYNLAMEHARKHAVSHDEALGLAPDEIDGFDVLFERYVELVTKHADKLWGYIELDQGGMANKIKTRARLEALGLRPIPVYHPLNDGWGYFDTLAQKYDRICCGNIVQALPQHRKRLVASVWDRKMRSYPDLWIHLLGLRPNQLLNAYPIDSADASSWLSAMRWSGYHEVADGASFGDLPQGFRYELGSLPEGETGSRKGTAMSAYGATLQQRNWRRHLSDLTDLGINHREIVP